jgi:hypothetical protein
MICPGRWWRLRIGLEKGGERSIEVRTPDERI